MKKVAEDVGFLPDVLLGYMRVDFEQGIVIRPAAYLLDNLYGDVEVVTEARKRMPELMYAELWEITI